MPTRSKTFDSHYPVTGDAIGTFPIHTDADVRVAVAQARIASDKWVALGFRGRKKEESFIGVEQVDYGTH